MNAGQAKKQKTSLSLFANPASSTHDKPEVRGFPWIPAYAGMTLK